MSGYSNSPYYDTAIQAADQYGVPENVFTELIGSESSFNPNAVSPTGATGIAQFTQGTANQYGVTRTDPTSSLTGAAHYLSDLFAKLGSWTSAVLAYKGADSPINQNLYGKSGTALLSSGLTSALANPSSAATSASGGTSTGTSGGSATNQAGSQTSPDTSASSNTSGCTSFISTPAACITAALTELGLIILALVVLAVGVYLIAKKEEGT